MQALDFLETTGNWGQPRIHSECSCGVAGATDVADTHSLPAASELVNVRCPSDLGVSREWAVVLKVA